MFRYWMMLISAMALSGCIPAPEYKGELSDYPSDRQHARAPENRGMEIWDAGTTLLKPMAQLWLGAMLYNYESFEGVRSLRQQAI